MEEQTRLTEEIQECNNACKECQESFMKEGITFSPTICRYCPTGAKLHKFLIRVSAAEAQWGNLDWNSCKYEKFYNG